jgi:hypothetical protein
MAIGDVLTVSVFSVQGNQNISSRWHYEIVQQTVPDWEICPSLANELIQAGLMTDYADLMPEPSITVGLRVDSQATDQIVVPGIESAEHAGTVVGQGAPVTLKRNLHLFTASANHRHRGIIGFGPGLVTDLEDASTLWKSAALTPLVTFFTNQVKFTLITASGEFNLVLPPTLDHGPIDIKAVNPSPRPGLQRSRRARSFGIG